MNFLQPNFKWLHTQEKILGRWFKHEYRRMISCLLVLTFTFTMTGLDSLVAHAIDAYHPDNPDQQDETGKPPSNPNAENYQNHAMNTMPATQNMGTNGPVVTETRMNLIKAELGSMLDVTSLKTVAQRVSSGMSVDTAVNMSLSNQTTIKADQLMDQPAERPGARPQMDAANAGDAAARATMGQGPVSLVVNMGAGEGLVKPSPAGPADLTQLPLASVTDMTNPGNTSTITPMASEIKPQEAGVTTGNDSAVVKTAAVVEINPADKPAGDVTGVKVDTGKLADTNAPVVKTDTATNPKPEVVVKDESKTETALVLGQEQKKVNSDQATNTEADAKMITGMKPEDAGRVVAAMKPEDAGLLLTGIKPEEAGKILKSMKPEELSKVISSMKPEDASKILGSMKPGEASKILSEMRPEDAGKVLKAMKPEDAVKVVKAMKPEDVNKIVTAMKPEEASKILSAMKPEDAAKVIAAMKPEDAGKVIAAMKPEDAGKVITAMKPEDAGKILGAMKPEDAGKLLSAMKPSDASKFLSAMKPEDAGKIITAMKPEDAGKVITAMKPEDAGKVITAMKPEDAGKVITAMKPEDAGKVITAMKPEDAGKVITAMKPEDAGKVMASVKPESAGKILAAMNPEDAGKVLATMKPDAAGKILKAMKPEDIGKILSAMKPGEAGKLLSLLKPGDASKIISAMKPADAARLLSAMKPGDAAKILNAMKPEDAGKLLSAMKPADAAKLMSAMKPGDAAKILNAMNPEDAGKLLAEMKPGDAKKILATLNVEDAGKLTTAMTKATVTGASVTTSTVGTKDLIDPTTGTVLGDSGMNPTLVSNRRGTVDVASLPEGTMPRTFTGNPPLTTLVVRDGNTGGVKLMTGDLTRAQLDIIPGALTTVNLNPNVYVDGDQNWVQVYQAATGNVNINSPPNIVQVVRDITTVTTAANQNQPVTLPTRPTGTTTGSNTGWYQPTNIEDRGLDKIYQHRDQPNENAGKKPGCFAQFMGSTIGKIFMFIISVILTVVSFGAAAPFLCAIMIVLMAINTFVPLPKWLSITLSIVCAALGGWASAIKTIAAQTAALATQMATSLATGAYTTFISAASQLSTLLSSTGTIIMSEVAKAVIAKVIVLLVAELLGDKANPVLMMFVGLAANVVAGGFAALIKGDSFGKGMLDTLKGMLNLKPEQGFGAALSQWSTLASPLVIQAGTLALQLIIAEKLESQGMKYEDRTMLSSVIAAGIMGGVSFTGVAKSTDATEFKFWPTMVSQVIAPLMTTAASTAFSSYGSQVLAAPKSQGGQGYSTAQIQMFQNNIGEFAGGLAPLLTFSSQGYQQSILGQFGQAVGQFGRGLGIGGQGPAQNAGVSSGSVAVGSTVDNSTNGVQNLEGQSEKGTKAVVVDGEGKVTKETTLPSNIADENKSLAQNSAPVVENGQALNGASAMTNAPVNQEVTGSKGGSGQTSSNSLSADNKLQNQLTGNQSLEGSNTPLPEGTKDLPGQMPSLNTETPKTENGTGLERPRDEGRMGESSGAPELVKVEGERQVKIPDALVDQGKTSNTQIGEKMNGDVTKGKDVKTSGSGSEGGKGLEKDPTKALENISKAITEGKLSDAYMPPSNGAPGSEPVSTGPIKSTDAKKLASLAPGVVNQLGQMLKQSNGALGKDFEIEVSQYKNAAGQNVSMMTATGADGTTLISAQVTVGGKNITTLVAQKTVGEGADAFSQVNTKVMNDKGQVVQDLNFRSKYVPESGTKGLDGVPGANANTSGGKNLGGADKGNEPGRDLKTQPSGPKLTPQNLKALMAGAVPIIGEAAPNVAAGNMPGKVLPSSTGTPGASNTASGSGEKTAGYDIVNSTDTKGRRTVTFKDGNETVTLEYKPGQGSDQVVQAKGGFLGLGKDYYKVSQDANGNTVIEGKYATVPGAKGNVSSTVFIPANDPNHAITYDIHSGQPEGMLERTPDGKWQTVKDTYRTKENGMVFKAMLDTNLAKDMSPADLTARIKSMQTAESIKQNPEFFAQAGKQIGASPFTEKGQAAISEWLKSDAGQMFTKQAVMNIMNSAVDDANKLVIQAGNNEARLKTANGTLAMAELGLLQLPNKDSKVSMDDFIRHAQQSGEAGLMVKAASALVSQGKNSEALTMVKETLSGMSLKSGSFAPGQRELVNQATDILSKITSTQNQTLDPGTIKTISDFAKLSEDRGLMIQAAGLQLASNPVGNQTSAESLIQTALNGSEKLSPDVRGDLAMRALDILQGNKKTDAPVFEQSKQLLQSSIDDQLKSDKVSASNMSQAARLCALEGRVPALDINMQRASEALTKLANTPNPMPDISKLSKQVADKLSLSGNVNSLMEMMGRVQTLSDKMVASGVQQWSLGDQGMLTRTSVGKYVLRQQTGDITTTTMMEMKENKLVPSRIEINDGKPVPRQVLIPTEKGFEVLDRTNVGVTLPNGKTVQHEMLINAKNSSPILERVEVDGMVYGVTVDPTKLASTAVEPLFDQANAHKQFIANEQKHANFTEEMFRGPGVRALTLEDMTKLGWSTEVAQKYVGTMALVAENGEIAIRMADGYRRLGQNQFTLPDGTVKVVAYETKLDLNNNVLEVCFSDGVTLNNFTEKGYDLVRKAGPNGSDGVFKASYLKDEKGEGELQRAELTLEDKSTGCVVKLIYDSKGDLTNRADLLDPANAKRLGYEVKEVSGGFVIKMGDREMAFTNTGRGMIKPEGGGGGGQQLVVEGDLVNTYKFTVGKMNGQSEKLTVDEITKQTVTLSMSGEQRTKTVTESSVLGKVVGQTEFAVNPEGLNTKVATSQYETIPNGSMQFVRTDAVSKVQSYKVGNETYSTSQTLREFKHVSTSREETINGVVRTVSEDMLKPGYKTFQDGNVQWDNSRGTWKPVTSTKYERIDNGSLQLVSTDLITPADESGKLHKTCAIGNVQWDNSGTWHPVSSSQYESANGAIRMVTTTLNGSKSYQEGNTTYELSGGWHAMNQSYMQDGFLVTKNLGTGQVTRVDDKGMTRTWGVGADGTLGWQASSRSFMHQGYLVSQNVGTKQITRTDERGYSYAWSKGSDGKEGWQPQSRNFMLDGFMVSQNLGTQQLTRTDELGISHTWGRNSQGEWGWNATSRTSMQDGYLVTRNLGTQQMTRTDETGMSFAWGRGEDGKLGWQPTSRSFMQEGYLVTQNLGTQQLTRTDEKGTSFAFGRNARGVWTWVATSQTFMQDGYLVTRALATQQLSRTDEQGISYTWGKSSKGTVGWLASSRATMRDGYLVSRNLGTQQLTRTNEHGVSLSWGKDVKGQWTWIPTSKTFMQDGYLVTKNLATQQLSRMDENGVGYTWGTDETGRGTWQPGSRTFMEDGYLVTKNLGTQQRTRTDEHGVSYTLSNGKWKPTSSTSMENGYLVTTQRANQQKTRTDERGVNYTFGKDSRGNERWMESSKTAMEGGHLVTRPLTGDVNLRLGTYTDNKGITYKEKVAGKGEYLPDSKAAMENGVLVNRPLNGPEQTRLGTYTDENGVTWQESTLGGGYQRLSVSRMEGGHMVTRSLVGDPKLRVGTFTDEMGVTWQEKIANGSDFVPSSKRTGVVKDGMTLVWTTSLLTGGKGRGTDIYGNQYAIDEAGKLNQGKGAVVMADKVIGVEIVNGVTVTKLQGLFPGGKVHGSDAAGNQYGIDEGGRMGFGKGAFVMMDKVLGGEVINGITVTKMQSLVPEKDKPEGKVHGSDMFGNQYGMDEKGKLGGGFRMLSRADGTIVIDGVTVTKMYNLLDKSTTGSDIYGNQYGVDKDGALGTQDQFRMLSENLGTETVNGVTATKTKDLINGQVTMKDMYGNEVHTFGQDSKNLGNSVVANASAFWNKTVNIFSGAWEITKGIWTDGGVWAKVGAVFAGIAAFVGATCASALFLVEGVLDVATVAAFYSMDYSPLGISFRALTGQSYSGELKTVLAWVAAHTIQPVIEWVGEKFEHWAEAATVKAEQSQAGSWARAGWAALAVVSKVVGENAAVVILMVVPLITAGIGGAIIKIAAKVLSQVMAAAIKSAVTIIVNAVKTVFHYAGQAMLINDGIQNGFGAMFKTFFIDPFGKVFHGLSGSYGDIRSTIGSLSEVLGGAVGLWFARDMLKGALKEGRETLKEQALKTAAEEIKAGVKAEGLEPVRAEGGPKPMMERTLGEIMKEKLGLNKETLSRSEKRLLDKITNSEWAHIEVGSLKVPNGITLGSMMPSARMELLNSSQFKLSKLQIEVAGKPRALGDFVKPSQMGMGWRSLPQQVAPALGGLLRGFVTSQVEQLTSIRESFKQVKESLAEYKSVASETPGQSLPGGAEVQARAERNTAREGEFGAGVETLRNQAEAALDKAGQAKGELNAVRQTGDAKAVAAAEGKFKALDAQANALLERWNNADNAYRELQQTAVEGAASQTAGSSVESKLAQVNAKTQKLNQMQMADLRAQVKDLPKDSQARKQMETKIESLEAQNARLQNETQLESSVDALKAKEESLAKKDAPLHEQAGLSAESRLNQAEVKAMEAEMKATEARQNIEALDQQMRNATTLEAFNEALGKKPEAMARAERAEAAKEDAAKEAKAAQFKADKQAVKDLTAALQNVSPTMEGIVARDLLDQVAKGVAGGDVRGMLGKLAQLLGGTSPSQTALKRALLNEMLQSGKLEQTAGMFKSFSGRLALQQMLKNAETRPVAEKILKEMTKGISEQERAEVTKALASESLSTTSAEGQAALKSLFGMEGTNFDPTMTTQKAGAIARARSALEEQFSNETGAGHESGRYTEGLKKFGAETTKALNRLEGELGSRGAVDAFTGRLSQKQVRQLADMAARGGDAGQMLQMLKGMHSESVRREVATASSSSQGNGSTGKELSKRVRAASPQSSAQRAIDMAGRQAVIEQTKGSSERARTAEQGFSDRVAKQRQAFKERLVQAEDAVRGADSPEAATKAQTALDRIRANAEAFEAQYPQEIAGAIQAASVSGSVPSVSQAKAELAQAREGNHPGRLTVAEKNYLSAVTQEGSRLADRIQACESDVVRARAQGDLAALESSGKALEAARTDAGAFASAHLSEASALARKLTGMLEGKLNTERQKEVMDQLKPLVENAERTLLQVKDLGERLQAPQEGSLQARALEGKVLEKQLTKNEVQQHFEQQKRDLAMAKVNEATTFESLRKAIKEYDGLQAPSRWQAATKWVASGVQRLMGWTGEKQTLARLRMDGQISESTYGQIREFISQSKTLERLQKQGSPRSVAEAVRLGERQAALIQEIQNTPGAVDAILRAEGVKTRIMDGTRVANKDFGRMLAEAVQTINKMKSGDVVARPEVMAKVIEASLAKYEQSCLEQRGTIRQQTLDLVEQVRRLGEKPDASAVDKVVAEFIKTQELVQRPYAPGESVKGLLKQIIGEGAKADAEATAALVDRFVDLQTAPLKPESRALIKAMIEGFCSDKKYSNFNADPLQLTLVSRSLEMHMLNFELSGKASSLAQRFSGEAMLLAMGGGKSAAVLSLVLARQLYSQAHGGRPAPASFYLTATETLVDQIVKDEPILGDLAGGKDPMVIKLTESNAKEICSEGLKPEKIYVLSNEGLKKIVLELRNQGKSDAAIREFFGRVGTKAWDEFHSAFHTTDTILGSSGVWNSLSGRVRAQITDSIQGLTENYLKVWDVVGKDIKLDQCSSKDNSLFVDRESGPGQGIRNQKMFNLEYKVQEGPFAGKTVREALASLGFDANSSGNFNQLSKMAQTMFNRNGREYAGTVIDGRPTYGTAEKGVGKANTIYGDHYQSAFQLIDIMVRHLENTGQRVAAESPLMMKNGKFIEAVGEALAHLTTERVTMLEAVELMGAGNVVGYTGTLVGLSATMRAMGKKIVEISPEPKTTFENQVAKGEVYMTVRVGDKVMVLEGNGQGREYRLTELSGRAAETYQVDRAMELAKTNKQLVYTHNDNGTMGAQAIELAMKKGYVSEEFGAQLIKTAREQGVQAMADMLLERAPEVAQKIIIIYEGSSGKPGTIERHFMEAMMKNDPQGTAWKVALTQAGKNGMIPEKSAETLLRTLQTQGMPALVEQLGRMKLTLEEQSALKTLAEKPLAEWGKDVASTDAMRTVAVADMVKPHPEGSAQVIIIDGMSAEAYAKAVESLKSGIHEMPKTIQAVLESKSAQNLTPEMRASLEVFLAAHPGAKLTDWVKTEWNNNSMLVRQTFKALEREFGWMQERHMFAPAIGEGLNIFHTVDGLPIELQFKSALFKGDLSPHDVFDQAMGRSNIYTEQRATGIAGTEPGAVQKTYKRVEGITGVDLDVFKINNILDAEVSAFAGYFERATRTLGNAVDVRPGERRLEISESEMRDLTHGRSGAEGSSFEAAQAKLGVIREFFNLVDGTMDAYLKEIDTNKAGEVSRTKAGDVQVSERVNVEQGSPEYMKAMAAKVEKDLPSRLREFQGVSDLVASADGKGTTSLMAGRSRVAEAMRTNSLTLELAKVLGQSQPSWGVKVLGALGSLPLLSALTYRWMDGYAAVKSAVQADGYKIGMVRSYAQTLQSQDWQTVMTWVTDHSAQVSALQAESPNGWLALAARQALDQRVADSYLKARPGYVPGSISAEDQASMLTTLRTSNHTDAVQAIKYVDSWMEKQKMLLDRVQKAYETHGTQWQQSFMVSTFGADWKFYHDLGNMSIRDQVKAIHAQGEAARHALVHIGQEQERLAASLKQTSNYFYDQGQVKSRTEMQLQLKQLESEQADYIQRYGTLPQGQPVQAAEPAGWKQFANAMPTLAKAALAVFSLVPLGLGTAHALAVQTAQPWLGDSSYSTQELTTAQEVHGIVSAEKQATAHEGSLLQEWKKQLKGSTDLGVAVHALQTVLKERGIELYVGNTARSYGHMYLVATLLSLVEQGLHEKVALNDLFRTIDLADSKHFGGLVIPKDAAGFLVTQQFVRTFMSQVSLRLAERMQETHPEVMSALQVLPYAPVVGTTEARRDPVLMAATFLREYILNGEELSYKIDTWAEPGQRAKLEETYQAVKNALGGKEYREADLGEVSLAIMRLENDGGLAMEETAQQIASIKDHDDKVTATQAFHLRFGISLEAYHELEAKPLGLRLLDTKWLGGGAKGGDVRRDPFKAIDRTSLRFAATGMAFALAAVGLAFVAWPLAIGAGLAAGAGLLASGVLLAQRDQIAWKANPTASVMDQLDRGKLTPEIKQALLQDDKFMLAVGGLRVPGTRQIISEVAYSDALCAAMNVFEAQLVAVSQDVEKQAGLAHQLVGVMQALRFNVSADVKSAVNKLDIQLTPTTQPTQALMVNNKFLRSLQKLNNLGVRIVLPLQWQQEQPMKLKTSDSAA